MKLLDLFAGIGGFSLGMEQAGCETIAFCECNEWCIENALQVNWPGIPVYRNIAELCRRIHHNLNETGQDYDGDYVECSIHGVDFGECPCIGTDQFLDEHGAPDIITAGVPCQPASLIGKRGGRDDSRWLWPDTLRVIEELGPTWVVFEQPPGILSLDRGDRFRDILHRLHAAGFDVWWETLPATAVGAGHRRERVFIIAHARSARLEGHARYGAKQGQAVTHRPVASPSVFPARHSGAWWKDQSPVPIVVDGVPDYAFWKQAIIATGNAVVPAIPEVIAHAIRETSCLDT